MNLFTWWANWRRRRAERRAKALERLSQELCAALLLRTAMHARRQRTGPRCTAYNPFLPTGHLCAWCVPGVNWPTGHGVCEGHKRELLLDLHLEHRPADSAPLSPV